MKRYFMLLFFTLLIIKATSQQDSIVVEVNGARFVMIKIEGGTFHRGCSPHHEKDLSCFKNTYGENTVTIKTFYLCKFETTNSQCYNIIKKCPSSVRKYNGTNVSNASFPVETISWEETQQFLNTLNSLSSYHFRLPTEAEWEYAARGGKNLDEYMYAGSDIIDEVAWQHYYPDGAYGEAVAWTCHVGRKKPNSLGLYDMSGNVAEWCSDWFSDNYYQTQKLFIDPKGPKTGEKKVIRGGGFGYAYEQFMNVRFRRCLNPNTKDMHVGFRLAMDAE